MEKEECSAPILVLVNIRCKLNGLVELSKFVLDDMLKFGSWTSKFTMEKKDYKEIAFGNLCDKVKATSVGEGLQ